MPKTRLTLTFHQLVGADVAFTPANLDIPAQWPSEDLQDPLRVILADAELRISPSDSNALGDTVQFFIHLDQEQNIQFWMEGDPLYVMEHLRTLRPGTSHKVCTLGMVIGHKDLALRDQVNLTHLGKAMAEMARP